MDAHRRAAMRSATWLAGLGWPALSWSQSPPPLATGTRVIRTAIVARDNGFDPAYISDTISAALVNSLFDAPLTYDPLARPAKLKPNTAAALPEHNDDFTHWVFTLKPGILFTPHPAFKGKARELVADDYNARLKFRNGYEVTQVRPLRFVSELGAVANPGTTTVEVNETYPVFDVVGRATRETKLTRKTAVVSPDVGGLKMASAYAQALGANLAIVAKQRKSATDTEALYVIGDVDDCDVLLVDDLTETAGTLTSAASVLKKKGARKIYAGVSHAVLVDIAIPRLQKSEIEELVTTNSTPVRTVDGFSTTVLCVSGLLGEGMKRIHNDESVSSLFKIDNDKK